MAAAGVRRSTLLGPVISQVEPTEPRSFDSSRDDAQHVGRGSLAMGQKALFITPPSTRRAAPVVADDRGLAR